jgi:hypothetical protein
MDHRTSLRVAMTFVAVGLSMVALSGCGAGSVASAGSAGTSASPRPASLLKQTFSGAHEIDSGVLDVGLTVDPAGSNTLRTPITISLSGPFDSHGSGTLPASDFTVSFSSGGGALTFGIISTGTVGYVSLDDTSYRLPTASFQKLERTLASVSSGAGGSGGSGLLGRLGIDPLTWLVHPVVAGEQVIGDASTMQIRAGIDMDVLLGDLSTVLEKASASGVSGAGALRSGLPPATRARIAAEVKRPTFNVWIGNADRTVRRLEIGLTLPVTGEVSAELGDLRSAHVVLTLTYADLNQPQRIVAPTVVKPYSQLSARLHSLVQTLEGSVLRG